MDSKGARVCKVPCLSSTSWCPCRVTGRDVTKEATWVSLLSTAVCCVLVVGMVFEMTRFSIRARCLASPEPSPPPPPPPSPRPRGKKVASQYEEVLMEWALTKGVFGRVAPNAHEPPVVFDDTNASLVPGRPQFLPAVCKQAVRLGARSTLVVPALTNFERQALVPHVPHLATSEAQYLGLVHVHEVGNLVV